jgi:hypothetical protein
MAAQSFLAKLGLRVSTLGSAANLAIAAPLAEGDLSMNAHTDPARIGVYFSRTVGAEKVGFVVMGSENFYVDNTIVRSNKPLVIDTGASTSVLPTIAGNEQIVLAFPDGSWGRLVGITYGGPVGINVAGIIAGGTRASPSATTASSQFFTNAAFGHNGTSFTTAKAQYQIRAQNNWSLTDNSTLHRWMGTPSGSTTTSIWMELKDRYLYVTDATAKVILGGDFSANVNVNSQACVTAYWGMQLRGNLQSDVSNPSWVTIGTLQSYGVILTSGAVPNAASVHIRGTATQTTPLLTAAPSSGTDVYSLNVDGSSLNTWTSTATSGSPSGIEVVGTYAPVSASTAVVTGLKSYLTLTTTSGAQANGVYGAQLGVIADPGAAVAASPLLGVYAGTVLRSSGAYTVSSSTMYGVYVNTVFQGYASGAQVNATNVMGVYVQPVSTMLTGSSGTVANYYGLYLADLSNTGPVALTITNRYGVYQLGAAALNYFAGSTGIGTLPTTTSQLTLAASTAGASGESSLRILPGTAPTTNITDGDIWLTSAGMFARINGVTKQLDNTVSTSGVSAGQIVYGDTTANTIIGSSQFTATANGGLLNILLSGTSTSTTAWQGLCATVTSTGAATTGPIVATCGALTATPGGAVSAGVVYYGLQGTAQTNSATPPTNTNLGAGAGSLQNISTAGVVLAGVGATPTYFTAATTGTGLWTLAGLVATPTLTATNATGTSTVTNAVGLWVRPGSFTTTGGGSTTVTNYYGLFIDEPTTSSVTLTNRWGIYQKGATASTITNYFGASFNTFQAGAGGAVGFTSGSLFTVTLGNNNSGGQNSTNLASFSYTNGGAITGANTASTLAVTMAWNTSNTSGSATTTAINLSTTYTNTNATAATLVSQVFSALSATSIVNNATGSAVTGTITHAGNYYIQSATTSTLTAGFTTAITNYYGITLGLNGGAWSLTNGGAGTTTITNLYGLYIGSYTLTGVTATNQFAIFSASTAASQLAGNLTIGTTLTAGNTTGAYNHQFYSTGGTTYGTALVGTFGPASTATAGNLFMIAVNKNGTDVVAMGVNKNSATGTVPSQSPFITTYFTTSNLSIGRGNGSGLPLYADINIGGNGNITIGEGTAQTGSAGTRTILTVQTAADTNRTAGGEVFDILFNLNRTVQWATGAIATQRAVLINAPTYAFVGASTITTAATLAISGSPIASTNATITNSYAFWVQSGISLFAGLVNHAAAVVNAVNSIATSGGSTAMAATDNAVVFTGTNTHTYNLTASGSTTNGRRVMLKNRSSGAVTINRGGADTIDGATSYNLVAGAAVILLLNGTDWTVN